MMTTEFMLEMLDAATSAHSWYVAYFLDGAEITGGSYARQSIAFDSAVALSETQVRAGSSGAVSFTNLPTTDVDEVRIVNTASGSITLTGWIIPHLRSFTSGDGVTYAADGVAVGLTSS